MYYATGAEYYKEACVSARSLKENNADIHVTVFTDQEKEENSFDAVEHIPSHDYPFLDRITYFLESPYEQTLFLDTDTYVTGDISAVFEQLEEYNVLAAHAPLRHSTTSHFESDVPESVPEFNCGVIAFDSGREVQQLFETWRELYGDHLDEGMNDQPFFREAMYKSDADVGVLPPEYNCRFIYPGYVEGEVRILHGRHPKLEEMAEVMNADTHRRVFTGNAHRRIFTYPMPVTERSYPGPGRLRYAAQTLLRHINENGWEQTMQTVRNRLGRLVR
ncbi:MAG: hypothetical protein SVS85_03045 [Candidatus Nanohaloarchaea archaeon]|nr:hypothetical protein [Candidatus Nanohaloarchaea archaeon]